MTPGSVEPSGMTTTPRIAPSGPLYGASTIGVLFEDELQPRMTRARTRAMRFISPPSASGGRVQGRCRGLALCDAAARSKVMDFGDGFVERGRRARHTRRRT